MFSSILYRLKSFDLDENTFLEIIHFGSILAETSHPDQGETSSSPSKSIRPMLAESCSVAGFESDLLPFAACHHPSLSPFHVDPL